MSNTLLKRLKDRKALVQKKPVVDFDYPSDEKPECTFRVKRLFGEDIREASNKISRGDEETRLNPFYNAMFRRLVPNIESCKDADGTEADIKEVQELMLKHFDQLDVVQFVLAYSIAVSEDEKAAEADPNE